MEEMWQTNKHLFCLSLSLSDDFTKIKIFPDVFYHGNGFFFCRTWAYVSKAIHCSQPGASDSYKQRHNTRESKYNTGHRTTTSMQTKWNTLLPLERVHSFYGLIIAWLPRAALHKFQFHFFHLSLKVFSVEIITAVVIDKVVINCHAYGIRKGSGNIQHVFSQLQEDYLVLG